MLDIVVGEGLAGQKGISRLLQAQLLKNFRQVKSSEEAKGIARTKNVLVYAPTYELDEGVYRDLQRNGGAVVFSFSDILHESGFRRAVLLSKMRLAFALCRKSGAGFVVCSLANEENGLRSAREIWAFMAVLGMGQHEKLHAEKLLERLAENLGRKRTAGAEMPAARKLKK